MLGMEKQSLRFASDGDPSLLTLEVPSEYSRSGDAVACVAFPVLARRGGLTLAVPLSAFDPEKLVDELQRSEEGLVGPSKSFVTDLVVEDDSGNPVVSEHRCRFLVVDFDDSVLPLLSEFNAETDFDRTVPFDADVPGGVPVADGLAEEVRAWAGGLNVGRVVFYSAREETDAPGAKSPGAVPKKATPKKVTNAMLVEQISQLAAQVQAISAMQQASVPPPAKSVAAALDPGVGAGIAPKMPSVIGTLAGGDALMLPDPGLLGQASKAVGLPPRIRPAPKVPSFPARPLTLDPAPAEEVAVSGGGALSSDPVIERSGSTINCFDCPCCPSNFKSRSVARPPSDRRKWSSFFYQRRAEAREASVGIGKWSKPILCASYAADAQTAQPGTACANERRRPHCFWDFDVELSRKDRRIPSAARFGDHHVDFGTCGGQSDTERCPYGPRASCSPGVRFGTGGGRSGPVELSLFDLVVRRAPSAALPRTDLSHEPVGTPIRPPHSIELVCDSPVLSEGVGDPHKSESRSWCSQVEAGSQKCPSRCRRDSIAQTSPSVPEEAEGRSRSRVDALAGEDDTAALSPPSRHASNNTRIGGLHSLNEERSVKSPELCKPDDCSLLSYRSGVLC